MALKFERNFHPIAKRAVFIRRMLLFLLVGIAFIFFSLLIAKVFATLYSIYSGVAFLTAVGVIFAPLIHRFLHFLHLENIESTNQL
jgi:hypothetical protein